MMQCTIADVPPAENNRNGRRLRQGVHILMRKTRGIVKYLDVELAKRLELKSLRSCRTFKMKNVKPCHKRKRRNWNVF